MLCRLAYRPHYNGPPSTFKAAGDCMTDKGRPVGVIGTGLMGTACAKRLRGAGFEVLGYAADAAKLKGIEALGAHAARSVKEIAAACDIVVLAVFNTDQVEEVSAALAAARGSAAPPLTVLCVSTCD